MSEILERLADLHKQATEERSHYYVGKRVRDAISTIAALEKRIGELEGERDSLKLQAISQAQEMRSQKSSLHEAYQYITGATGEPGNWNGARPIKEAVDKLRQALTAERQRRESAERALRPLDEAFASYGNAERDSLSKMRGCLGLWHFSDAAAHLAHYAHANDLSEEGKGG